MHLLRKKTIKKKNNNNYFFSILKMFFFILKIFSSLKLTIKKANSLQTKIGVFNVTLSLILTQY